MAHLTVNCSSCWEDVLRCGCDEGEDMAYKKISGRDTESLERDAELAAFGGEMREGIHNAVIEDITLGETFADVLFKNGFEETMKQRLFFNNFNGTDMAYLLKQLISSTVEEPTELFKYLDSPTSVRDLTGKAVSLEIGSNGGIKYKNTTEGYSAGQYSANTLTELRQLLQVDGLKLARNEVKEIHRHDDTIKESKNTTKRGSDTGESNKGASGKVSPNFDF
jgi:hypothetical protein